jgi:hypothetical protein
VTDIDPKWIETAAKALADAANQTEGATDDARCLTDEAECFQTYPVHFAWYQTGQTGIVGETTAVARMVLEAAAGLIAERAAADARAQERERIAVALEANCAWHHDRLDADDPCDDCAQHAAVARRGES